MCAVGSDDLHSKLPHLQHILSKHRPDIGPIVDIYKDIHQNPELSTFEARTASIVARYIKNLSLQVWTSIGGHGVVDVLKNGPGKTILLRAELDALPIEEQTGLPYASKARMNDFAGREQPVMHACGHDIHIACLLAAVRLLCSAAVRHPFGRFSAQ